MFVRRSRLSPESAHRTNGNVRRQLHRAAELLRNQTRALNLMLALEVKFGTSAPRKAQQRRRGAPSRGSRRGV